MASEKAPWRGDRWWVSPLNFQPEVVRLERPHEVVIHDVTLRDGEQTPGVVFRKEEKLAIARALDEIGVQRIEAGMPVVSEEDMAAVKTIAHAGLQAKIFGFARLVKDDVDASIKAGVAGIICEGPVGVPKLKQFNWTYEQVIERAIETIDYAKAHGLHTIFFGVDTTRAEIPFLKKLYRTLARETKVNGLVLVDTFGCATPEAIKHLVLIVKKLVDLPLEVHCHNDFGLGTACTVAGIIAGARVAHTSVSGLGERAGNAALEEVALSLRLLYGAKLNLSFEKLTRLSRLIEKLSRFRLAHNKPVVGQRAFTREAGIAIAGWLKYHLGSEAYLPELVGNRYGIVLGKKSGSHSIEWKLRQLGLQATQDQVQEILQRVKHTSEAKKGSVSDQEFRQITASVLAVAARP